MEVTIKITIQEAQLIMNALAELPLKNSIDTWFKIRGQIESQMQQAQPPGQVPSPAPTPSGSETVQ